MRIYGGLTWDALAKMIGIELHAVAFALILLRERGQVRASAEVSGGINLAFSNERSMDYWNATCDDSEMAEAQYHIHMARVAASEGM